MINSGKYRARIEDYGVIEAPYGQQHLTAYVTFRLIGYYNPTTGALESCPDETREYRKAFTDNTIKWLLGDIKAIGYDREALTYFDPEVEGAVDLFGREIVVRCEHKTYNGQTREEWSISQAPRPKRVDRSVLAELDDRFRDQIKKILGPQKPAPPVPPAPAPPVPPAPAPPVPPAPAPPDDDDPF
jgi:hypothetical protein